jgi:uncharacterized protein YjbJ (UPF0337 family)
MAMRAAAQTARNRLRNLNHGVHCMSCEVLHIFFRSKFQENAMNKDQAAGRVDEVKGKVKEVAGKVVGNRTLEQKGKIQNAKGKVQAGYGDLKEDIKKSH